MQTKLQRLGGILYREGYLIILCKVNRIAKCKLDLVPAVRIGDRLDSAFGIALIGHIIALVIRVHV